jgi:hypothetical protein
MSRVVEYVLIGLFALLSAPLAAGLIAIAVIAAYVMLFTDSPIEAARDPTGLLLLWAGIYAGLCYCALRQR